MSSISNLSARVIADYQAPYADPISVNAGDRIIIDNSKKTDWHGWIWCTNQLGKSGWVPEAYIDRHGDVGYLRYDYDAIELNVRVGEILICHKEESGFVWATNQMNQNGWVPLTHIDLISREAEQLQSCL